MYDNTEYTHTHTKQIIHAVRGKCFKIADVKIKDYYTISN